jgi:hypothetical protein
LHSSKTSGIAAFSTTASLVTGFIQLALWSGTVMPIFAGEKLGRVPHLMGGFVL